MEEIEGNISTPVPNNTMYDSNHTIVATINSTADADNFRNKYNHANNYNGLKLGQIINIKYNNYTSQFIRAGFDMESNRYASDGTLYDNGYGICLIPYSNLDGGTVWNTYSNATPYINSSMHTSTLPTMASKLQSVLGNHLINRNVLLSSSIDRSFENNNTTGCCTNGYRWTTAYCTLLSLYQYTGFGMSRSNYNVGGDYEIGYDLYGIGEANYMLPLFSFDYFKYGGWASFTLRNIIYFGSVYTKTYQAFTGAPIDEHSNSTYSVGLVDLNYSHPNYYVRPMIYIR